MSILLWLIALITIIGLLAVPSIMRKEDEPKEPGVTLPYAFVVGLIAFVTFRYAEKQYNQIWTIQHPDCTALVKDGWTCLRSTTENAAFWSQFFNPALAVTVIAAIIFLASLVNFINATGKKSSRH